MHDKVVSHTDLDVIQIRLYRSSDREAVRKLFRECIVTGAGSPARVSLTRRLETPSFRCAFLVMTLALITSFFYGGATRVVCLCLSVALAFYLCILMYASIAGYINFCNSGFKDDLDDVAGHYQLQPANCNSEELVSSNVRGFWVAEFKSIKMGVSEIVGCVGLDVSRLYGPGTGELRRLVVSPYHRRRGIAAALTAECEAQAKKYRLSSIVLSTTENQPSARHLYTRKGYAIAREWDFPSHFTRIQAFDYRKYLVQ